jgi:hypothetical protein
MILVTPMMEATHSSETSVPTRATRRDIPEYGILLRTIMFGAEKKDKEFYVSSNFTVYH